MRVFLLLGISLLFGMNLSAQNIFRTACQGNLIRLDSLLTHSSIDEKDYRERSLLHWAVACDQRSVFDYLMEKGIDINAMDDQKKTALNMAIRFERETYFDELLKLQADSDWKEEYGPSLLETAVLKKSKKYIGKLVDHGVDVNGTNQRGSTALEIAQRINAGEISEYLLTLGADKDLVRNFELKGAYIGQSQPGTIPEVFAPNFISTEEYEFGSVFNAAGTEFYYGVDTGDNSEIRFSELEHGIWTKPVVLLSHEVYGYNDPFLSPDETRLYFISRMALEGTGPQKDDHDIWYVERREGTWSEPINAGPNINSNRNEYYISFTKDGTMYFSSSIHATEDNKESDLDIYYSKFSNGEFQKAVRLSDSINTEGYEADVFIDPGEEYIIFCSTRTGGFGRGDLYISFKKDDGSWTKSINMGGIINSKHHELCPFVTIDGKYLFYTSNEDIYWVSTKIIEELKVKSN